MLLLVFSQLNEVYSGKEFLLSRRYSAALNTFFVTMLYSSGMPILLIIAAVTFTLAYWFDKYTCEYHILPLHVLCQFHALQIMLRSCTVFRHYRLPERFDASLANYTAVLMPYAVMLHLLMALWFYDCPSFTSVFSRFATVPYVYTLCVDCLIPDTRCLSGTVYCLWKRCGRLNRQLGDKYPNPAFQMEHVPDLGVPGCDAVLASGVLGHLAVDCRQSHPEGNLLLLLLQPTSNACRQHPVVL